MVEVKSELPPYHVLTVDLVLPHAAGLQLYGKAAWNGPDFLTGIRFLGLTDEQRKALADWVSAQPNEVGS